MPRDPMIHAWRLVKSRHAATAFDGAGARLNGARWSSPGVRVAYASDSIALATLEILAHLHSTSILSSYSLASVQFAGKLIEDLVADKLPSQWRRYPAPAEIGRAHV